jgi:hypothetical protein
MAIIPLSGDVTPAVAPRSGYDCYVDTSGTLFEACLALERRQGTSDFRPPGFGRPPVLLRRRGSGHSRGLLHFPLEASGTPSPRSILSTISSNSSSRAGFYLIPA